ncbi:hypothetical protein HDU98_006459 [Podochytrium sp. JEL0797]|nr:hypothetical protein HDU98_006459 [Podochytrium sp. JEL0797]
MSHAYQRIPTHDVAVLNTTQQGASAAASAAQQATANPPLSGGGPLSASIPASSSRQPKRTTKTSQKQVLFPADADDEAAVQNIQNQQQMQMQQQAAYKTTQKEEFLRRVNKESLPRATAYCTCSRYNLDQLMEYLFSRKMTNGTSPRRYDEALYTPYSFSPFFGQYDPSTSAADPNLNTNPETNESSSSSSAASSSEQMLQSLLLPSSQNGTTPPRAVFETSTAPVQFANPPPLSHSITLESTTTAPPPPPATTLNGGTSYGDFSDTIEAVGSGSYKDLVRRTTVPELIFFDFGVVVMWGLTEEEEQEVLLDIRPFEEESIDHNDLESEKFHYLYSRQQQARIYNDIITLISPTSSVMIKLTISYAFAQSAKLTLFEGLIEETIESTRRIPSVMAETGKIHMHRKAINKKIGQLFIMRINVNLVSNVLDTPEIFWSEPAFEPLYTAIRGYLEINQRVDLVNQRVAVISDLLAMLKDNLTSTHGEQLEWIVIFLIGLEIVIGLITITLKKDPKYKRYVNAIDAILKMFDSVNEWADVIGFLSKLLKVFFAYANVPRKLIVSKRLAQCLNPALPSGVHQKTLEVYQAIFEAAGPAQLAEDLPLWSYGLFPFFQNAAMSVKPVLLHIYSHHYLTLSATSLHPSLKGLLLALLPGLEEEGNEFFEPVMDMLDCLCKSMGTRVFFGGVALAMGSGARVRGAAVCYLGRRMPRFREKKELTEILGTETLVMCRALSASLEDKQILVQRGALELLVVHFPLQNELFPEDEVVELIRAAIGVVLRKDMSLNRRLYSWLLGSSTSLSLTSRESLISTIRNMLWTYSEDIHDLTKPYRIMLSLMDKEEIGNVLLDRILLDVFKSLKQRSVTFAGYKELLQSAEMLLDAINPYAIWKHIYHLVQANPIGPCQNMQVYELLEYMLGIIRVDEEEVKRIHLPMLFYWLTAQLETLKSSDDLTLNAQKLPLFLHLCSTVLSKIPHQSIVQSWTLKNPQFASQTETVATSFPHSSFDESKRGRSRSVDSPDISIASFCSILYGNGEGASEEVGVDDPTVFSSPYFSEFAVGRPVVMMGFEKLVGFLESLVRQVVCVFGGGGGDGAIGKDGESADVGGEVSNKKSYSLVVLLEVVCAMVGQLACSTIDVSVDGDAAEGGGRGRVVSHGSEMDKWDWFGVLGDCAARTTEFSVLNICLTCMDQILLRASKSGISLNFDVEQFIQIAVSKLWFYLDPEFGIYHTRAVELIWQVGSITKFGAYIVENVVANFLSSRDLVELVSHQQRFGILWRLSETNQKQTGIAFSRPLFLVLDGLRSQIPSVRRSGEAWLKTYVTSYSRVIEPILATLLHPDIVVLSESIAVEDREEKVYFYKREFNMGQVLYSLETLCLLLVGYRPLLQTLWSERIREADFLDTKDVEWLEEEFETTLDQLNYAEVLIYICLRFVVAFMRAVCVLKQSCYRFLRTEIHAGGVFHPNYEKLQAINTSIQSQSCEFISKFLGFSELQSSMNSVVVRVLIHKLSYSIAVAQLDLQPRLLMVMSSLHENQEKMMLSQRSAQRRNSLTVGDALDNLIVSSREVLGLSPSTSKLDEQIDSFETSPTFLHMILAALTKPSNRHVLQHWIDFILLLLPRLNLSFRSALQPILSVLCSQISVREHEIAEYVSWCQENYRNRGVMGAPDNDVVILVAALDKVVQFCLTSEVNWNRGVGDKAKGSGSGGGGGTLWDYNLTGIVTSVFVDNSANEAVDSEPKNSRDAIIELLPGVLIVLKNLFSLFRADPFAENASTQNHAISGASLDFLCSCVKSSIRRVLETVYSKYPAHLIESVVEVWFSDCQETLLYDASKSTYTIDHAVLSMLHLVPECSPKVVMSTVVEGLKTRFLFHTNAATSKEKGNPFHVRSKQISDSHLLFFLEKYIAFCVDPETMNALWPSLHTYAKDCLPLPAILNANYFLPSMLRLITVCVEKLILTRHFDDKRMRFHMDEMYQKLLDLTIQYCAKPPDAPLPVLQGPTTMTASPPAGFPAVHKPSTAFISADIQVYLSTTIIPHLRKLVLDQEKILGVMTNLVYYLLGPQLKMNPNLIGARYKPLLEILAAVAAKLPFAVKTWKKETWDAFLDARFFEMHVTPFRVWKGIVNVLANADKEARVAEIAAKISAANSSSIFVSRDQELQMRVYSVRRLSFLIWCGTVDQYLPQLPLIQEKLVEILKGPAGPIHSEAYLCLRILMCRMTAHHLANLWPIVLTELIQIFGVYLRDHGTKDDLQVFLSCCKLLELLLLLGTEEFQWHQWIFISEMVDFGSPSPVDGDVAEMAVALQQPTSLVDKLSVKWGIATREATPQEESSFIRSVNSQPLRRPLLTMRSVLDKRQLAPFIGTLSHHTYSSTFAASKPDMVCIEELLEADIMDVDAASYSSPVASGGVRSLGSGSAGLGSPRSDRV